MPSTFRSFGEQALAYFDRPHATVRRTPLEVPAAWRGAALCCGDGWIDCLTEAEIDELDRARRSARGRALESLTAEDFPLPTLAVRARGWAQQLARGRGFVLLRGLPVASWGDDDAALVYWGLGLHLGIPGAQNPMGELLGHVHDTGEDVENPNVRLYRTRSHIRFHCDLADVVGLLCLRASQRGGASRIASSTTVYNEILRRRPDLVERLYEPFLLDSRNEGNAARFVPVPPCRFDGTRLRTFFHSDYFRSVVRHPEVGRLGATEIELLDLFEEIAGSAEIRLDMQLEPGDVQLLSNHVVVHARTAYEDDPAHPRHLLRLWLSLPEEGAPRS
jgi:hypothetical protein